ncbi:NTE family protein [Arthrobacter sp. 2762]
MNTTPFSTLPVTPTTTSAQPRSSQDQPQENPATIPGHLTGRALVLGGGGSTGNAWLIGVIAGMFDAGMDVTTADLTVGTSAGSTAAAQIAGASASELYAATLAAPPQPERQRPRQATQTEPSPTQSNPAQAGPARQVVDHLERTQKIIEASADPADMRRQMGAAALKLPATADESRQTQWRETVASRLPSLQWPQRTVLITAVDARTGQPVVFDRHSGVELVDAVAASCASGFAYSIGDGRYIDGGYRSNAENADLATGYARVLVLSPFGGRTRTPLGWGLHLATQVDELRADGSKVETVFPDSSSEHMFGANAMDASMRPAAAQAGYEQGQALAQQLTGFWNG